MYDFYEEPRHLNMKKVIGISIVLVVLLIGLIIWIAQKISAPKVTPNLETTPTSTVFYSQDHSASIELSNHFNLEPRDSDLGYFIELHSENNLNIFVAKETMLPNQELASIVEADKIAYLDNFESHSNLSDTKQLSVNDHLAYTYSFHYLDKSLNQAFYLQTTWLQINDDLYVFDIEFPLDDLAFNTNITSSVLSSFQVYSE